MQQNQRFVLFLILSMGLFFAWFTLGPKFFPGLFPQPPKKVQKKDDKDDPKPKTKKKAKRVDNGRKKVVNGKREPVEAPKPGRPAAKGAKKQKDDGPNVAKRDKPQPPAWKPDLSKGKPILLGSEDPRDGYFIQAQISPNGGAVNWIKLNDERYRNVEDRNEQLKVVGSTDDDERTFDLTVPAIDDILSQLRPVKASLNKVRWKVGPIEKTDGIVTAVTLSFSMPDSPIKVIRRYSLVPVVEAKTDLRKAQDTKTGGYELKFELGFENTSKTDEQVVKYSLQGPVGVPLEDLENVRVFRSIVTGLVDDGGDVDVDSIDAETVVENEAKDEWTQPIQFLGVDVQYFAALVLPDENQRESQYFELARPQVVENVGKDQHADISVVFESKALTLAPQGKVTHKLKLYAGPKRKDLLAAYEAEGIINYGWSLISPIARGMLWLLNLFHSIGLPYGIAIIFLTFVVRGALFPLSRKQVASMRKTKELAPKIAELKKKYANDREKLARAQMELYAKSGVNPLAGCLPIFLQLPIFIGLYQSLSNAVELRLAPFPFTWIDNLAAPDALFELGFRVPLVGWTTFNLLPIITIFLFVAQQKMFMPPPTDEQQALQQKMMMYMSVFFGFLFYKVPSGLCIYFIASSIWGLAERKILDSNADSAPPEDKSPPKKDDDARDKPKGFFGKLIDMADQAAAAKAQSNGNAREEKQKQPQGAPSRSGGSRRRKGKRKRR